MFRVQSCRVLRTGLSCSVCQPSLFIALLPCKADMLPSPFILSFYLRHTDDQLVKVEITSSHSRFSRMFVPFYGKV